MYLPQKEISITILFYNKQQKNYNTGQFWKTMKSFLTNEGWVENSGTILIYCQKIINRDGILKS